VRDAALQRPPRPRIDIFDGEIALDGRGFPDGFRDGALLDAAAVEDSGLVEMDMRLDQARHDKTARGIQLRCVGFQPGRDGGDGAAIDADIDDAKLTVLQDAGVPNNQVHQFTAADRTPG